MNEPAYCKSCGAYIPEGRKKCLACGFPIEIPSLGGDKDKVETVPLDGVFYAISEKYYSKGKPDIDLDALMDMRFFTVKVGGVVSKYYFADRPKTTLFPMNENELGRTINGRIIYGGTCGAKRIIDLKLIER